MTDTSHDLAYTYDGGRPHAANTVGSRTYQYDENGVLSFVRAVDDSGAGVCWIRVNAEGNDHLVGESEKIRKSRAGPRNSRTAEENDTALVSGIQKVIWD